MPKTHFISLWRSWKFISKRQGNHEPLTIKGRGGSMHRRETLDRILNSCVVYSLILSYNHMLVNINNRFIPLCSVFDLAILCRDGHGHSFDLGNKAWEVFNSCGQIVIFFSYCSSTSPLCNSQDHTRPPPCRYQTPWILQREPHLTECCMCSPAKCQMTEIKDKQIYEMSTLPRQCLLSGCCWHRLPCRHPTQVLIFSWN